MKGVLQHNCATVRQEDAIEKRKSGAMPRGRHGRVGKRKKRCGCGAVAKKNSVGNRLSVDECGLGEEGSVLSASENAVDGGVFFLVAIGGSAEVAL